MNVIWNSLKTRLSLYKKDLKEKGTLSFITSRARKNKETLLCKYFKILRSSNKFKFQGSSFGYFIHKYNFTWNNERIIEIPLILREIEKNKGKQILEVGNVLSHYFKINHDVLDKYEKGKGVINKDILDFQPQRKYDLIISISTIEHIGWDEKQRDDSKIINVIKKLKQILQKSGKIIITFPIGYNSVLDRLVNEGKIKFSEKYFLKRISKNNKWKEVGLNDISKIKFNHPFPFGNVVLIGTINNL